MPDLIADEMLTGPDMVEDDEVAAGLICYRSKRAKHVDLNEDGDAVGFRAFVFVWGAACGYAWSAMQDCCTAASMRSNLYRPSWTRAYPHPRS